MGCVCLFVCVCSGASLSVQGRRHFCVLGKQNMRFTTGDVGIFVFLGSKICVLQRGTWVFLCSWEAKYAFYNGGRRYFCVPGKQNMRFTTGDVSIFVFLGSKICVLQRGTYPC